MKTYAFVHLEFGPLYRQQSVDVLGRLRRELAGKGDPVSLVIVDNASTSPPEPYRAAGFAPAFVTGGDNSNHEFSGWDKGVAETLARAPRPDIWVFSNDTVARNHGWGKQKVAHYARAQSPLRRHIGPWLFGEINDFPQSLVTPLGPQLEWVSSYLFTMNETLRDGLGTISPGDALLDTVVRDRFEPGRGLFREGVDEGYAAFLSSWLIRSEGETVGRPGYKWYKATPLTAQSFDQLRMKLRCCVSENMLSYRARQLGADIRSPYDARNAREHIRKSWHFISDKIGEKLILHRHRS